MAINLPDGSYGCSYCGKSYTDPIKADNCRDSHDVLYIPMSKSELNKLLHAIIMEDFKLIPPKLWETLQRYAKFQVTDGSHGKV